MSEALNLTGFAGADRFRLPAALAGSIVFHALLIAGGHVLGQRTKPVAAPQVALQAILQPQPSPAPVLLVPEPEPMPPAVAPPRPSSPTPPQPRRSGFQLDEPASQALRQVAQHLLYPPEAITRGLEGEAQVTLFLDDAGNAIAARLERSSGHAILDEAAVNAARTVRTLPDGAPREVLLPVRFRLR